jgi:Spy/CpxP family protein refolding chaperone
MAGLRMVVRSLVGLLGLTAVALAQSPSPYVLLQARGLGYALTAELNSYPGPMHVLELTSELGLTPAQVERTRIIMDAMKAEGRAIGARIVDAETHLERMFRMGHIDAERLRAQTAAIGGLEADLRRAHLAAHLEMRTLLTPEQVAAYEQLRGYGAGGQGHGRHGTGAHSPGMKH